MRFLHPLSLLAQYFKDPANSLQGYSVVPVLRTGGLVVVNCLLYVQVCAHSPAPAVQDQPEAKQQDKPVTGYSLAEKEDTRLLAALQVYEKAIEEADLKARITSAYSVGERYSELNRRDEAENKLQEGLELALQFRLYPLQAEGFLQRARHHQRSNEVRPAITCLNKVLQLAGTHPLQQLEAEAHHLLGTNYHSLGLYETALTHQLQALALYEGLQDPPGIAKAYSSIGRVYQYTKSLSEARTYFLRALAINTATANEKGRMACMLNIGVVFQKEGAYDSALSYFRQALPLARALEMHSDEAKLIGNIGSTHMQQGKLDEALQYLLQALALKEKIQSHRSLLHTLNDLAELSLLRQEPQAAMAYAERVVRLARLYEEGNQLRYGYLNLSKSHKQLRQFEQAHAYLEKYDAVKDSLFGLEQARQISQLNIQYETEKGPGAGQPAAGTGPAGYPHPGLPADRGYSAAGQRAALLQPAPQNQKAPAAAGKGKGGRPAQIQFLCQHLTRVPYPSYPDPGANR
ncbi:tetratricopeptide repeat protein [Cesiribacter andamanensis]|uniref:Putative ATPase n=1 Tax=Cesiribacter andamanensis AMV16 TaxID=1279009 RepID=M7NKK6_9BACT|nr:tetratricopeptide repeat protein [Cesiribacter andamanensis]EMR02295.1 putative ATPase [Cesiribacter andamanensis AMV16]